MAFPPVAEQLDAIRQGALEIVPEDELARKLERAARTGTPLIVKQGFDPTRPDLHIGHAVSIRKLRTFQELGHQVVFVVGDSTAMIGDPTGRNELRPPLSEEEVRENARSYTDQVFRILDPEKTRVEFNSTWLAPLRLADLLKLTAQYTVARMLEREDFAKRYGEGRPISLVEFMYPLMQAYDSVALQADVELGGSDQKFNLLVARAIQERYGQEPQVCLLMPLLRGADGRKMSKSYDNYVGLADEPGQQYGRTLSIADDLLEEWWTLASGATGRELEEGLALARTDPYRAKRALAGRIVAGYHGADAAAAAAEEFDRLFKRHELPDAMPEHDVDSADPALGPADGTVLLARLLARVGLASSNADGVRQVEQGAVSVDGEKAAGGRDARVPARGTVVLQKGRRHFARVRFGPPE